MIFYIIRDTFKVSLIIVKSLNGHRKINDFLAEHSQSDTQSMTLTQKIEGDSDIVYEIDYKDRFKIFCKRHEILDPQEGEGWVILTCHKLKKRFFHLIQTPNKFSLICRACQQEV